MARVAVTFAVNCDNLKTEGGKISKWRIIEHLEDPKTDFARDFGAKRVVEEDTKFINDTSALLVCDMSSSELYEGEFIMLMCPAVGLMPGDHRDPDVEKQAGKKCIKTQLHIVTTLVATKPAVVV